MFLMSSDMSLLRRQTSLRQINEFGNEGKREYVLIHFSCSRHDVVNNVVLGVVEVSEMKPFWLDLPRSTMMSLSSSSDVWTGFNGKESPAVDYGKSMKTAEVFLNTYRRAFGLDTIEQENERHIDFELFRQSANIVRVISITDWIICRRRRILSQ